MKIDILGFWNAIIEYNLYYGYINSVEYIENTDNVICLFVTFPDDGVTKYSLIESNIKKNILTMINTTHDIIQKDLLSYIFRSQYQLPKKFIKLTCKLTKI
jgi:hypothetical protein